MSDVRSTMWKGKTAKQTLFPHQGKSLPSTIEYYQLNVLRAHMQCGIWKHDDKAKPPDIDQTLDGWKRGAINKTLEPTLLPTNTSVAPDPPDVHVLVSCCLVQYSEGAMVDWIVLMSTLKWQWNTYLMLKMKNNLITSISRFS